MAINLRFNATPGSLPTVYLEQPVEPGQPRLFWQAQATPPAWTTPATMTSAYQVASPEDSFIPGQFLLQVPTSITSLWPSKVYLATVLDPNSLTRDDIFDQLQINLVNGDDGGNGIAPTILAPGEYTVTGSLVIPLLPAVFGKPEKGK